MPNWCECDLTISGNADLIKDLKDKYSDEDGPISFEKILPTPPEKLANEGWYDWRIVHWGTKWDRNIYSQNLNEKGNKLTVSFGTAWGPPIAIMYKLGKLYPKLKFVMKYYEGGMGFQGKYVMKDGENTTDEYKSYSGPRGG